MVKEEEDAERVFADTSVHITCTGKRHLGTAIDTQSFIEEFVHERVAAWKEELKHLSAFARTEPHAAYSAFPHGLALFLLKIPRALRMSKAWKQEVMSQYFDPSRFFEDHHS